MHILEKLENDHACTGKGSGEKKKFDKTLSLNPQADPQHRDSLQQSNKNNIKN